MQEQEVVKSLLEVIRTLTEELRAVNERLKQAEERLQAQEREIDRLKMLLDAKEKELEAAREGRWWWYPNTGGTIVPARVRIVPFEPDSGTGGVTFTTGGEVWWQ